MRLKTERESRERKFIKCVRNASCNEMGNIIGPGGGCGMRCLPDRLLYEGSDSDLVVWYRVVFSNVIPKARVISGFPRGVNGIRVLLKSYAEQKSDNFLPALRGSV